MKEHLNIIQEVKLGNQVSLLITLLYDGTLLQCAIKIDDSTLSDDFYLAFMEIENREAIHALLPLHIRNCGPIVDVKIIFDVWIKE